MGTFITDRLQHLNNDLVQLFNLDRQPLVHHRHHRGAAPSGAGSSSTQANTATATSDTGNQGGEDTVKEQSDVALLSGLNASIGVLDLGSGTVPSMDKVLHEIEKVESLFASAPIYHRGGGEIAKLENIFLAKCTIAVYLNLLDIILNATLPLANEIQYWQSLLDNQSWRLFYVVQSKPSPNPARSVPHTTHHTTIVHTHSMASWRGNCREESNQSVL